MKRTNRPWINDARNLMNTTRDSAARRLASIDGLHVPKTAKISSFTQQSISKALQELKIDFPILVRKTGTHTGQTLQLLRRVDEVPEDIGQRGNWYVTEFVDFKSQDGNYRKYRVLTIGDNIILKHLYMSDNWNVHRESHIRFVDENNDNFYDDSYEILTNRFMNTSYLKAIFENIKQKIGLDYFGVDFGICGESVLLFEANAAMNLLPASYYAAKVVINDIASALVDLICKKGFAVDTTEQLRIEHSQPSTRDRLREAETTDKTHLLPELPIKIAVLTGSDTDRNNKFHRKSNDQILSNNSIFTKIIKCIDRNLIRF